MDCKHAKVGMEVYIKKDISITIKRHNASPEMYTMCGQKYKIQSVGPKYLIIDKWTWAEEDVELADVDMSIEIDPEKFSSNTNTQLFDTKNL